MGESNELCTAAVHFFLSLSLYIFIFSIYFPISKSVSFHGVLYIERYSKYTSAAVQTKALSASQKKRSQNPIYMCIRQYSICTDSAFTLLAPQRFHTAVWLHAEREKNRIIPIGKRIVVSIVHFLFIHSPGIYNFFMNFFVHFFLFFCCSQDFMI